MQELDRIIIPEPLIDSSLVPPAPDAPPGSPWFLFASNRNQKMQKNCRELEIWWA